MKAKKTIIAQLLVAVLLLALAGCGGAAEGGEFILSDKALSPCAPDDNVGTYYEIFVGAFSDSDGDGLGDLRGIINRLDYLNDGDAGNGMSLGVDGLWLMPVMPAGSYHKYDVYDYKDIDEDYGTLEDFDALIAECDKRGVKVIIDLVLNHTSEWHPWFKEAKKAVADGDFENQYVDYYSLSTEERGGWAPFAKAPDGTQYYYECNFAASMPELNYDNPEVLEEVSSIVGFWLERGVAGFRLDAIKYFYYEDEVRNKEVLDWLYGVCRSYNPDVYLIGENWSSQASIVNYYESVNCFDFTVGGSNGEAALTANGSLSVNDFVSHIESYRRDILSRREDAILAPFVSNHDMDRAAGFLSVEEGYMQMAANLYMLSSGNPYIYYGEEIGMYGSRGTSNTDANRRLGMLWGDGDTVADPAGTTFSPDRQKNGTVAAQLSDENSLYNHYKKLIMLRNANPQIARGEYRALRFDGQYFFGGFTAEQDGVTVGVFHNTGYEEAVIDLSGCTDVEFSELRGYAGKGSAKLEGTVLTISPLTSAIVR